MVEGGHSFSRAYFAGQGCSGNNHILRVVCRLAGGRRRLERAIIGYRTRVLHMKAVAPQVAFVSVACMREEVSDVISLDYYMDVDDRRLF